MTLTPVDILHTQFETAMRGYNKGQVEEFMSSVREALEEALKESNELKHKLESLQYEVERVRNIESTLSDTLVYAQKSADEIKAASHKQAEAILQEVEQARVQIMMDAQKQAEKCHNEITQLEATRDRFESEFKATLNGYLDWLDKRKHCDDIRAEVA